MGQLITENKNVLKINNNIALAIKDGIPFPVESGNDITYLIPVSRYSLGMSRGAYFLTQSEFKYCGKFYYHEPGSLVLLNITKNRHRFFENKYGAGLTLLEETIDTPDEEIMKLRIELVKVVETFEKSVGNQLRYKYLIQLNKINKLKMNKLNNQKVETVESIMSNLRNQSMGLSYDSNILNLSYTINGEYTDILYAKEDIFDQILCLMGRKLNIDVMILSKMPGKSRVVSELLHTRGGLESFDNLVRIIT
jgi:hypothetical protein